MRRVKSSDVDRRVWADYALIFVGVFALGIGWFARLYNLGFPPRQIWDEIYFPVFARDYLNGTPFFDLHPPLGKFIIAFGIGLAGDTPFGWRLMPALFGCAMVPLAGALGWYYFKERAGALLLATFIACETMLIVYSRTGLMDGILVFFVLATFLAGGTRPAETADPVADGATRSDRGREVGGLPAGRARRLRSLAQGLLEAVLVYSVGSCNRLPLCSIRRPGCQPDWGR
jgi:4-amino-4-deoxy-L-arabinose transferase-like glycosyltransferase